MKIHLSSMPLIHTSQPPATFLACIHTLAASALHCHLHRAASRRRREGVSHVSMVIPSHGCGWIAWRQGDPSLSASPTSIPSSAVAHPSFFLALYVYACLCPSVHALCHACLPPAAAAAASATMSKHQCIFVGSGILKVELLFLYILFLPIPL